LQTAVEKAKLGNTDKQQAIRKLHEIAAKAEKNFMPNNNFNEFIEKERNESWMYGGKTVFGDAKPPKQKNKGVQLRLF
jgi:hypothetical protein